MTSTTVTLSPPVRSAAEEQWQSFEVVMQRFSKMFSLTSRVNRLVIPYHRFVGLSYILQFLASVVLMNANFRLFMRTPLWCTLSLCGTQAVSAAWYFRHTTPKKKDPGFMSMGDVGRLSWFFVVENIFFSLLLWFQNCYFHPQLFAMGRGAERFSLLGVVFAAVEVLFVFLPYCWRPLFPKTALRDSHRSRATNTAPSNVDFYTKNTYVVKAFYNFAKHYIGFFLNYVQFLGRVAPFSDAHQHIYMVDLNGGYMATGGIFFHTLVFKNILSNKTGAMLYQAGYPFTVYLYYKMLRNVICANPDLALLSGVAMALNFLPDLRFYHAYQGFLAVFFFAWRAGLEGRGSNDLFDAGNRGAFLEFLKQQPQRAVAAAAACALVFVVVVSHRLPGWARALNPFYPCAKRLKRERPHPEDDKEE